MEPVETTKGVYALTDEWTATDEASQIEDDVYSTAATVIEAEFPGASEDPIRFASEELYARCRGEEGVHILWITPELLEYVKGLGIGPASLTSSIAPSVTSLVEGEDGVFADISKITTTLDNDGNAFAIAVGFDSCCPGSSTIEADLLSKPFYDRNHAVRHPGSGLCRDPRHRSSPRARDYRHSRRLSGSRPI